MTEEAKKIGPVRKTALWLWGADGELGKDGTAEIRPKDAITRMTVITLMLALTHRICFALVDPRWSTAADAEPTWLLSWMPAWVVSWLSVPLVGLGVAAAMTAVLSWQKDRKVTPSQAVLSVVFTPLYSALLIGIAVVRGGDALPTALQYDINLTSLMTIFLLMTVVTVWFAKTETLIFMVVLLCLSVSVINAGASELIAGDHLSATRAAFEFMPIPVAIVLGRLINQARQSNAAKKEPESSEKRAEESKEG